MFYPQTMTHQLWPQFASPPLSAWESLIQTLRGNTLSQVAAFIFLGSIFPLLLYDIPPPPSLSELGSNSWRTHRPEHHHLLAAPRHSNKYLVHFHSTTNPSLWIQTRGSAGFESSWIPPPRIIYQLWRPGNVEYPNVLRYSMGPQHIETSGCWGICTNSIRCIK